MKILVLSLSIILSACVSIQTSHMSFVDQMNAYIKIYKIKAIDRKHIVQTVSYFYDRNGYAEIFRPEDDPIKNAPLLIDAEDLLLVEELPNGNLSYHYKAPTHWPNRYCYYYLIVDHTKYVKSWGFDYTEDPKRNCGAGG